jgi:anti-anti-sigma factor
MVEQVWDTDPPLSVRTAPKEGPITRLTAVGRHLTVGLCGELDIETRDDVYCACVMGNYDVVVVEMIDLTFMDCGGFAALVTASRVLQQRSASLVLSHATGQPDRLLTILRASGLAV